MDPDDLLRMLDLGGQESPQPGEELGISSPDEAGTLTASPTALAVDEWGLRRGRDLIAESERLQKLAVEDLAAADFFAAAFDPDPQLLTACEDRRRHAFVAQLLETPEYRVLHAQTRLDDTAAAIAAAAFAEQFARLASTEEGAARGDAMGEEMATLRAVGRALATAREEVSELKETAAALGMGPGGHRRPLQAGAVGPHAAADLCPGRSLPAGGPEPAAAEADAWARRRGRRRARR